MKATVLYGVAAALILGVLGVGVTGLVDSADPGAVWLAAGVAWPVQMAAFTALVLGREGVGFMMSWAGGMAIRLAMVGAVAVWVDRTGTFDTASALVSLVGFLFVLVLLEPLFLRLTDD